ncbi:META domain-containing protein [Halomonas denitrificans]|uniref:META domain-containing protein n=1 Tax=Halomonas denitrificans TaxID=370769 RepID=UPI000D3D4180|nr:META domain-containing protein [Halomonas denitrificans]
MKRIIQVSAMLLVALLLAGCASTARTVDEPLVNTYWKLTHLSDAPVTVVEQQREAHFVLRVDDQRVMGSTGCNRMTGSYRLEGDALSFEQLASTRRACADGMQTEQAFLDALGRVAEWRIEGQQLTLVDAGGEVLARLQAVHLT